MLVGLVSFGLVVPWCAQADASNVTGALVNPVPTPGRGQAVSRSVWPSVHEVNTFRLRQQQQASQRLHECSEPEPVILHAHEVLVSPALDLCEVPLRDANL
jgi:hypothetical protein